MRRTGGRRAGPSIESAIGGHCGTRSGAKKRAKSSAPTERAAPSWLKCWKGWPAKEPSLRIGRRAERRSVDVSTSRTADRIT
eukprot:6808006-Pyramimonas_sp.AAC.1